MLSTPQTERLTTESTMEFDEHQDFIKFDNINENKIKDDFVETSTNLNELNFPSVDFNEKESINEINSSQKSLRRKQFRKKILIKSTTETMPTSQVTENEFDFDQRTTTEIQNDFFDIAPKKNLKQEFLASSQLTGGSNGRLSQSTANSNSLSFDEFEDKPIDEIDFSRNSQQKKMPIKPTISAPQPSKTTVSNKIEINTEEPDIPTTTLKTFPNFEMVEIVTTTRFSQLNRIVSEPPKIESFGRFDFEPIPRQN